MSSLLGGILALFDAPDYARQSLKPVWAVIGTMQSPSLWTTQMDSIIFGFLQ